MSIWHFSDILPNEAEASRLQLLSIEDTELN
jgi:hypothetical protein